MSATQDRIRKAAVDNGWEQVAKAGQKMGYGRQPNRPWDRDIFKIGSVDRHLLDGRPVTEAEHSISVYWNRSGAVGWASGDHATVERWNHYQIYRSEKNKADKVLAALANQSSKFE